MFISKLIEDKFYIFSIVGYMLLTAISGAILGNGLVLFLTINMFLASISYGLSVIADYVHTEKMKKWLLALLSALWLLFFPNTIYITTDFIHLQNYEFFTHYNDAYAFIFSDWYVLFIIFLGAMISAKIGIKSVLVMIDVWQIKKNLHKILCISGIFVLSSIGIYIGRFIRLNSWDFYRLDIIFNGIAKEFWFFLGFVVMMVLIHFIYYILFKNKK